MEQQLHHRAKDFRRMAWQALKGVWGIAIVVALVAGLLGANSSVAMPNVRVNVNITNEDSAAQLEELEMRVDEIENIGNPEDAQFVEHMRTMLAFSQRTLEIYNTPAMRAVGSIASILALVAVIIGGPIKVGYARFRLKIADGKRPLKFKELFSGFDVFGEAFLLQLRITLRVLGWTLLFFIPGIIAAYRYSQAYNIMAEHPELSSGACIEQSKAMMNGNKWRLFCLQFSYIGWAFLCALTLGILSLWVAPYAAIAESFFYREVSGTLGAAQPDGGMYGQPENFTQRQAADDDYWKNF